MAETTRQGSRTTAGSEFRTVIIGGIPISILSIVETADLMLKIIRERPRGRPPVFMTSANGEVIASYHSDKKIASDFDKAEFIHADGQPIVMASRLLTKTPLPERVATTDLFDIVAEKAIEQGATFYLYGATEEENARAAAAVLRRHPQLRLVGRSHGYLTGDALAARINEINELAPDILWVGLGVPREQAFCVEWAPRLTNVKIMKTCGGLFNFMSGKNRRAPVWAQKLSLEWAWRAMLEPRRLLWRYITTNPRAAYLMLTRSR